MASGWLSLDATGPVDGQRANVYSKLALSTVVSLSWSYKNKEAKKQKKTPQNQQRNATKQNKTNSPQNKSLQTQVKRKMYFEI